MLSLAKLALLASGEAERSDQRSLLDAELDLVAHQEDLPESVLIAYGYDIDALNVLPPAELIQVNWITVLCIYYTLMCLYQ